MVRLIQEKFNTKRRMITLNLKNKLLSIAASAAIAVSAVAGSALSVDPVEAATKDASASYEWGTLKIGGGGFVSGIVTGKQAMYARTDVGGAYRYNYKTDSWEQLLGFINEDDRGLLSVDAMAIDPTDDNTAYFLCGCAYFSAEKTVIYKTTNGGETFEEYDVTDMIQVHGNGNGRQTGESIAVDPDDPNTIYCGGDVYAGDSCLIKSTDGGKTWKTVKGYGDLGNFKYEIKWPTWGSNMRHALTNEEYYAQNGIACIYIYGGKVYVGASDKGENSVVVADVKDDKFTDISDKLDPANYPGRITGDGKGNIFFAFQGGVQVGTGGTSGSIKKMDAKTGTVTDISPLAHLYNPASKEMEAAGQGGYSGVSVDPANPDHMVSSTCGLFANAQLWEPWTEEHGPCWGDKFFRSEDGGKTWREISPGYSPAWQKIAADYLSTGGYDWIYDKAIHWVGSYVIDPVNPDRTFSTSGNGVFACDNTWADMPQFYFHPDGIEEVVSLDFVSTADGLDLSAIGDYDGFVHEGVDKIPPQYKPNMGSTSAIAVCPSNTDVWARTANGDGNNTGSGYYTLDRGKTWTAFKPACTGGKLAITELSGGKIRILNTSTSGAASYSDDFGGTWNKCDGIQASKGVYMLVDPDDPKTVYASGAQHNDYWSSDMTKKEPTYDESHYSYFVSDDYGATFKETRVCPYNWELTWKFEHTGDPAYLGKGTVAIAGANQGLYLISDKGAKVEKVEGVSYAKCVGYGAPKTKGDVNVLYIYGKPLEDDLEGIYASEDSGKTWYCINTDHLYGGTGNGNYLVGDLNEYGKVYMSTVGCGIVYGKLQGSEPNPVEPTKPKVTTQVTTKAVTTTTTTIATTVTTASSEQITTTAVSTTSDPVINTTATVSTAEPQKTTTVTTKAPDPTTTPAATTTDSTSTPISNPDTDYVYGDVDLSGLVELADVTRLSKFLLNPQSYPLGNNDAASEAKSKKQADVTGDGDINTLDLSKLIEYNIGKITAKELIPVK